MAERVPHLGILLNAAGHSTEGIRTIQTKSYHPERTMAERVPHLGILLNAAGHSTEGIRTIKAIIRNAECC